MNGTCLIQNLKWLGKSNELIDLFGGSIESSSPWQWQRIGSSSQEMCEVDDDKDCNEEYDEDKEGRLTGRGAVVSSCWRDDEMIK